MTLMVIIIIVKIMIITVIVKMITITKKTNRTLKNAQTSNK